MSKTREIVMSLREGFSFKKDARATGLARVSEPIPATTIKLNGKMVGRIAIRRTFGDPRGGEKWKVSVAIQREPTPEDPAPFKNVFFKPDFDNDEAAKAWFIANAEKIASTYKLHTFD